MANWLLPITSIVYLNLVYSSTVKRAKSWKDLHAGKFAKWSTWSLCSEKVCCRHGVTSRRRHCIQAPCTGIETESKDCPTKSCVECSSGPLAATTTAATGSFINSECETSRKHWSSGPLASLIRLSTNNTSTALKRIISSGFFGVQKVFWGKERKRLLVYKYCFEPTLSFTFRQAKNIFRSNRRTRISRLKSNSKRQVNGIVITAFRSGKIFKPGIFWTAIDGNGETAYFYYGKSPFKL